MFCARNAVAGVPASFAGWRGRGRKSTGRRCGQTIEAQPAFGQIRPSEVRVARPERTQGDVAATGCMTQEDERTARGKTCAGASTAVMQAREDTAGLTIGVARSECALGTNAHSWPLAVERRPWADERRDIVCGDEGRNGHTCGAREARSPNCAGGRTSDAATFTTSRAETATGG